MRKFLIVVTVNFLLFVILQYDNLLTIFLFRPRLTEKVSKLPAGKKRLAVTELINSLYEKDTKTGKLCLKPDHPKLNQYKDSPLESYTCGVNEESNCFNVF